MLKEYPDVMTVYQASQALGICEASLRRLIAQNIIGHRRVGRRILIPKVCLIDYLNSARYTVSHL